MISPSAMLGYDWEAQKRRCPIAADARPVKKEAAAPIRSGIERCYPMLGVKPEWVAEAAELAL